MLYGTHNFNADAAQQKQLLAELLLQSGGAETYPASLPQQRLWFLDQLQGKNAAYNVHVGLWLRGSFDLDALRASLHEMIRRHESLRTAFRLEGNDLRQVVAPQLSLSVPVTD